MRFLHHHRFKSLIILSILLTILTIITISSYFHLNSSNHLCSWIPFKLHSSKYQIELMFKPTFTPNEPLYLNDQSIIFVITPTYNRSTQIPDLTRLGQTLRLVPNIYWILVEDSTVKCQLVESLLHRMQLPFVHLLGPKPFEDAGFGVSSRLRGLEWIKQNYAQTNQQGVFYFADDDNTYDIRVFDEMRQTKKLSMFPVGGISPYGVSSPIVDKQSGRIVDFHDLFGAKFNRTFAVDMAGFAVNLQYFLSRPNVTMAYPNGQQEDSLIKSLGVQLADIEPVAKNCTEILVWHTQTRPVERLDLTHLFMVKDYEKTNLELLYKNVNAQEL